MEVNGRQVIPFAPVSVASAGTASGYVDCLGADYLELDVVAGTSNTVSNTPSVLTLSEGDTTSAFTNISGAVAGTDFTVANSSTANPNGWKFRVDLRARKRYIKVAVSPLTTMVIAAVANLHRNEQGAQNAAAANVLNLIEV